MSRIRSLHPRIFTDEHYVALSLAARELLKGLWCEAWDDGVVEWRPLRLKMRIFPIDQIDVEALLAELVREQFILHLTAGNREYAVIRNFRKWQKPKKPSASGVLPQHLHDFIGLKAGTYLGKVEGAPDAAAETLDQQAVPNLFSTASERVEDQFGTGGENLCQKGGREEGRKVLEGSLRSPSPRASAPAAPLAPEGGGNLNSDDDDGFQAFWAAYPPDARTAPDYARRAYAKALRLGATPERILTALRRDLERAGKRQPLAPAAWLMGGSWRLQEEARAALPAARADSGDPRFEGWGLSDHMALRQWRLAKGNHWLTPDMRRNDLPENERCLDLWETITSNRPRVALFLRQHEPAGIPHVAADQAA